jgi:guanylate kinase
MYCKDNMTVKGKVIIVSAPSGAGKTTIVRHLLSCPFNLKFSVSATSRKPRANETDGTDYFFLSEEQFRHRIRNGDFLEWEEVYPGIYYGTLRSEVYRLRDDGYNVIFDVDVVGGLDLKEIFQTDALAIFVSPPSIDDLDERLKARSTETAEKIAMRVAKAESEMKFAPRFDVILLNDLLDKVLAKAEQITKEFLFNENE